MFKGGLWRRRSSHHHPARRASLFSHLRLAYLPAGEPQEAYRKRVAVRFLWITIRCSCMKPFDREGITRLSAQILDRVAAPGLDRNLAVRLLAREIWSIISVQNDVVRTTLLNLHERVGGLTEPDWPVTVDLPGDYEWPEEGQRPPA